jgi:hypothetical protein
MTNDKNLVHYHQYNLWQKMINFDHSPKSSPIAFIIGAVYGWVCNLFLLDINTFTWEFVIKGASGVMFAVISGFCVKVTNTFYEEKIKNKLFKRKRKPKAVIKDL